MYFDYAATTPPDPDVLSTFEQVNREMWANPHALHQPGAKAEALLEQCRRQVLALLSAEKQYRCIFTSGATESNNMAIIGAVRRAASRGRHIITSAVEHPSVAVTCLHLEQKGCEVTRLPVDAGGRVDPDELQRALRDDTVVVSLMHINNESGSINDIERLGEVVKQCSAALFHVDAAQSAGKVSIELDSGSVDMLSLSAHKFYGLKGSGALILRSGIDLPPLLHGGGQEYGLRSGTADPARAAALAKALRLAVETQEAAWPRVQEFKRMIVEALTAISGVELNGELEYSSPYILNVSVPGVRPETILQALSEQGIYISTVSACSAQAIAESSVVLALTGSQARAQTSIRISLSALTTEQEVTDLCATLGPVIEALRFERK